MPRMTRDREVVYEHNRRRIKNAIRLACKATGPITPEVEIVNAFSTGRRLIGDNPAITNAELVAGLTTFIVSVRP